LTDAQKAFDASLLPTPVVTALTVSMPTRSAANRLLTDDRGLPEPPVVQHLLYAPGFYTGYGVKTIPGVVREASSTRNGRGE